MPDPVEGTAADPWCCLCGQQHAFGKPCDQERLDAVRRQADLVRRLAFIQRRREAADA